MPKVITEENALSEITLRMLNLADLLGAFPVAASKIHEREWRRLMAYSPKDETSEMLSRIKKINLI